MGYVQQDTHLFFGSMRENITVSALTRTTALLCMRPRVGGIDEFINLQPKVMTCRSGSEGRRCRRAEAGSWHARAVLSHPSCIVLDEPPVRWTIQARKW